MNFKILILRIILAGILLLLLLNSPFVQADQGVPIDVQGNVIEYSDIKKAIKVKGNILVRYKNIKITADEATAYPETKEIYATGNVTLYKDGDIFKADKIYYNLKTKQGTLINGNFQSGKIFGKCKKLKQLSNKELVALNGYFTTCELDIPHYTMRAKEIKIFPGEKVVARNLFFYIGNIPIMYFPYYSHSLKDNETGFRVTPGHSKDWGYFVLTSLRYYFNGRSNGFLHLDWRKNLGIGEGLDYKYETKNFGKGLLQTYYTNERDKRLPEGIPNEKQKYRVKLEHSWDIDNYTRALLEINKYKDKNFIKDYFYKEYVKDPEPTSYISLIRRKDYYTLSFLARERLNDFMTVTEVLPEIKFDVNNYRLGNSMFYYTSEYSFDSFNRKEGDSDIDNHVIRFQTDNKLTYPTRLMGSLNWLQFTPYAGRIETLYTRDIDGNDRDFFRGLWYAGYDLTTKIYKIFDLHGSYFNTEINGLRHLIVPDISYTYYGEPNVPASRLYEFDSIDAYEGEKYYTFSLENRLQTKWYKEGSADTQDMEEVDLVRHRISVKFYPQIEGHQFSNITNWLSLQPKRWLTFDFDWSYNPYTKNMDIFNAETEARTDKWTLNLSSRYDRVNDFHEGILDATYKLSPKWKLGIYERYNFRASDLAEQEYSLERDLHCWTMQISWNIEDGGTIWVVFKTKAFPELPFSFAKSYPGHRTETGS